MLLLALALLAAPLTPPPDSVGSIVEATGRAYLEAAPQAVALSIGVVQGDSIRTFHFGTTEPGGTAPPTEASRYTIASITKTFTASLVAHAAHEGLLDPHADVRRYLAVPLENLEFGGQPVTLAHLLGHASGLPDMLPDRPEMYPDYEGYGGDIAAWMAYRAAFAPDYDRAAFFRDLAGVRLSAVPGTRFGYSNAAVQLAAYVLEAVYDRPYAALVDSLIAAPLGLTATTVGLPDSPHMLAGYDETGRALPPNPDDLPAAGAIRATARARYARWHLDESDPVVALAHTPTRPDLSDPPYPGFALGLNWQMQMLPSGAHRVYQNGNVPGFSSLIVAVPDLDVAVVVLANELDREIPGLIAAVADRVLAALDPGTARQPVPPPDPVPEATCPGRGGGVG